MLASKFEEFVSSIQITNKVEEIKRVKEITKRLNRSYYEDCDSETEHCKIVGSLGRNTAIKSFSDIDMLFILPISKKKQYDLYNGNGQSKLLQDVKKEIKKKYPKTIVRGDGQVVVVRFESLNKIVEVCPVFRREDGSFLYPDSNNGGKWKITNPVPEIEESNSLNSITNNNYSYLCHLIRSWKNNKGFKFNGLLIDTLVYNFFVTNVRYNTVTFENYLEMLKEIFEYLKDLNEEQSYWYALGSNQKVYNKNGEFVKKAEKEFNKIRELTEESDDLYEKLQQIFGQNFPVPHTVSKSVAYYVYNANRVENTEEFIENIFALDIRYFLKIDCTIKEDGYRPISLRNLLISRDRIKSQKTLEFIIVENEFAKIYKDRDSTLFSPSNEKVKFEVYWKVLNRGQEAIRKNCIRGQIVKGGNKKTESSDFNGDHFVECYIVYRDTVVARDRIHVPIQVRNV